MLEMVRKIFTIHDQSHNPDIDYSRVDYIDDDRNHRQQQESDNIRLLGGH